MELNTYFKLSSNWCKGKLSSIKKNWITVKIA